MSSALTGLALASAVLCASLAAMALWRLRAALDRLHAVSFLNATAFVFVAAASFVTDGVTPRSLKLAAIVVVLLLSGAAISHATGRALLIREGRGA